MLDVRKCHEGRLKNLERVLWARKTISGTKKIKIKSK